MIFGPCIAWPLREIETQLPQLPLRLCLSQGAIFQKFTLTFGRKNRGIHGPLLWMAPFFQQFTKLQLQTTPGYARLCSQPLQKKIHETADLKWFGSLSSSNFPGV